MKKISLILCLVLAFCVIIPLSGCDTKSEAQVYLLNFKPESARVYQSIAADYEKETGIPIKVVTAAANTYEQTLKSEIAKSGAPTIFQLNGPIGYNSWKDYCMDLKDTKFYSLLTDKSLAITDGEGVYGVPYVVEGYGIIYNDAIMRKYFALGDKKVNITSAEQINNFSTLKAVVEDMTAKKEALGIKGVFASTSLTGGEDWRWQTHLANVPLYYEFSENTDYTDPTLAGLNSDDIAVKYGQNFKNLFDLYLNNSVTERGLLGSKSVADSMAEFALGQAAMVQNGNWAWSQIADVKGNVVKSEDIKFLPLYTGMKGEEEQGLCIGTESYFAINRNASDEAKKQSLDFLYWLFSSEKGKKYVTQELGFLTPFNSFSENEQPEDPLGREMIKWMNNKDVNNVPWIFTAFPGENFKTTFGSALLEYAQGTKDFAAVIETVKNTWKQER